MANSPAMIPLRVFLGALLLSIGGARAAAAQAAAPAEPPPHVEASARLAFVQTRGNTSTQSLGAGAETIWRSDPWTEAAKFDFAQAQADEVLTARSIAALDRVSRTLKPKLSAYGQYDFLRDTFAGVEQRHVVEGGFSYAAVDTAQQHLRLDAGLGYLDEHRPADRLQSASFAPGAAYKWVISPTSEFTYTPRFLLLFTDSEAWKFDQDIAVTAALNTVLSLKLGYTVRYSAKPPTGFDSTDTILAASLVMKMRSK